MPIRGENIPQNKRAKLRYTYYVSGSGPFPFVMLWRDDCRPKNSHDAAKMAGPLFRSIAMIGYKPPTFDRWHLQGWLVSEKPRSFPPILSAPIQPESVIDTTDPL